MRREWSEYTPVELMEAKASGYGSAGLEIERRLGERDRFKAALEAITTESGAVARSIAAEALALPTIQRGPEDR